MSPVPAFPSAADAMATVRSGLRFLAATDATQMPVQTQAECLQMLEQADAISTAARASILGAFAAGEGYSANADYSPRAWLINRTRITKGAAVAHTAWIRRAAAHLLIAQALAEGEISESFARTICKWTDRLPEDCRAVADEILVSAARTGMDLRDLAGLAGEIYARRPDASDDDPDDDGFDDRSVRLETTFGGAGVLNGDLTPECAAVVTEVLDALSAPAGAEDTRTYAQRGHTSYCHRSNPERGPTLSSRDVSKPWRQRPAGPMPAAPRPAAARIGLGGVTGRIIRPVTPPLMGPLRPRVPPPRVQLRLGRSRTLVPRRCSPSLRRCGLYPRRAPPRREYLRRHRG